MGKYDRCGEVCHDIILIALLLFIAVAASFEFLPYLRWYRGYVTELFKTAAYLSLIGNRHSLHSVRALCHPMTTPSILRLMRQCESCNPFSPVQNYAAVFYPSLPSASSTTLFSQSSNLQTFLIRAFSQKQSWIQARSRITRRRKLLFLTNSLH